MRLVAAISTMWACIYFQAEAGQVSAVIHADGQSRSILTADTLTNIFIGPHGYLAHGSSGSTNSTFERTYIDATQGSEAFISSVTVSNVTYSGVATNWLRQDAVTNMEAEYISMQLPGGPDGIYTNLIVAGFVKFCVTNNTGSQVNLDHVVVYGGGGWCVCQLSLDTIGRIAILPHANTNGGSTFGPGFYITPCKTYFRVSYRDGIAGRCCMKIFDPADWSLIGEGCAGMYAGEVSWEIEFKTGYIGNIPQNVYFGDQFMIYGATDSDYTNIVSRALSATFGNAILRNVRNN